MQDNNSKDFESLWTNQAVEKVFTILKYFIKKMYLTNLNAKIKLNFTKSSNPEQLFEVLKTTDLEIHEFS